jgi:hypothetical protein
MPPWLLSALNQFIDRKPDEMITYLVIALFIAVGAAGVFRLISRGHADPSLQLTVVVMVASLLTTICVNLYGRYRQDHSRRQPVEGPAALRSTGQFFTADALAVRVLSELDTNHDNYLSAEEASAGATDFMEHAKALANAVDIGGVAEVKPQPIAPGGLDANQIRRAIRDRMGPRAPGRPR